VSSSSKAAALRPVGDDAGRELPARPRQQSSIRRAVAVRYDDERMEAAPGALVTPNVRLVRPLASGSMGSVWLAEHLRLDTQVAVKLVGGDHFDRDEELVARFEREAKAAARIKSPHVVEIFDYGLTAAGLPYMVLELLDGESLAERLEREGPLRPQDVATVVRHVARGLSAAHELSIVHRDIKPANIFVTSAHGRMHCKVLDFGIAKRVANRRVDDESITELTADGLLVGTLGYMGPEQMLGSGLVDSQCDLWALAVVAYECLTGVMPFDSDDMAELGNALLRSRFEAPSERGQPDALDDFFAKAFHRRPSERFESALALTEALDDLVAQLAPPSSDGAAAMARGVPAPGQPTEDGDTDIIPLPTDASKDDPSTRMATPAAGDHEDEDTTLLRPVPRTPQRRLRWMALGAVALLLVLGLMWRSAGDDQRTPQPAAVPGPTAAPRPVSDEEPPTEAVVEVNQAGRAPAASKVDAAPQVAQSSGQASGPSATHRRPSAKSARPNRDARPSDALPARPLGF
jgi:serine/threonine-protein kinase